MAENLLTVRQLENAKPKDERLDTYFSDGGGLYARLLKTPPSGGKTIVFQYRYKLDGKTAYYHCGTYPQTSLAEARERRNAARKLVLQCIHPTAEEKRVRQQRAQAALAESMEQTVKQMFETWERLYLASHRKDGGKLVRQFFATDVLPQIGAMRAKDVTKRILVTQVIEPMLRDEGKRRRKANAVLSMLKQMFRDGAARGAIDVDPSQGLTRAQAGGDEAARTRNLGEDEITILAKAMPSAGLPERLEAAIWLYLATGVRVNELVGAKYPDEFDLDARTWLIPPERSKNGKAHLVHLSSFALRWLAVLIEKNEGGYLLPGRSPDEPISSKWPSKCIKDRQRTKALKNRSSKIGALVLPGGPWTPHDLRRTLASRMGDLRIAPHVIEKCLNHSLGGLLAVYQHQEYHEERRAAFEEWGRRLETLTSAAADKTTRPRKQRANH